MTDLHRESNPFLPFTQSTGVPHALTMSQCLHYCISLYYGISHNFLIQSRWSTKLQPGLQLDSINGPYYTGITGNDSRPDSRHLWSWSLRSIDQSILLIESPGHGNIFRNVEFKSSLLTSGTVGSWGATLNLSIIWKNVLKYQTLLMMYNVIISEVWNQRNFYVWVFLGGATHPHSL